MLAEPAMSSDTPTPNDSLLASNDHNFIVIACNWRWPADVEVDVALLVEREDERNGT